MLVKNNIYINNMDENILKQAKGDIYKAVYDVIEFDIKKGISAEALNRYYKKPKNILTLIGRIHNKGSNLFSNEDEYNETVMKAINEIVRDRINSIKDKKERNKHIKEWVEFNEDYYGSFDRPSIDDSKKKNLIYDNTLG